jgi:two-component system, OmpR family, alkaline phosphatase synthesis response regulator PhoP
MAGEKVLVVDDNPQIIELLEDHFSRGGYHVINASNGHEALAKVYQERPDLILLDIMMPLLDGYEICRTLKNNQETKHIPVIFITARGEAAHIERGFELKADGYVVKPFDPKELSDFAARILETFRRPDAPVSGPV